MTTRQYRPRRPWWLRIITWIGILFGLLVLSLLTQATPTTFVLCAAVLMVLAWWLRRRGSPPGRNTLLIGTALALWCSVALGRGYTATTPRAPPGTPAAVFDYSHGRGFLSFDLYQLDDPAETHYVVFYPLGDDPLVELEIVLPEVESLGRAWGISTATVTAGGSLAADFIPRYRRLTADANPDAAANTVSPFITVELPITAAQRHETIDVRAVARVQYYAPDGTDGYTLISEETTRDLSLFVGTPAEFALRRTYNRTSGLRAMIAGSAHGTLWMTTLFGGTLIAVGYRRGQGYGWRGTGNLQWEARRTITLRDVATIRARGQTTRPQEGALVRTVVADSAPHRDGLREADIIIRVNDTYTPTARAVYAAFGDVRTYGPVAVMIWREGDVRTLDVDFDEATPPNSDDDSPIRPA